MSTDQHEPRAYAHAVESSPRLPRGDDERFAGYGVMGQPFRGGDFLAMRHFPATSVGPGYRALWHRDGTGRWTIYADAAPEVSCARYFGAALEATRTAPVEVEWTGASTLTVTVPPVLTWDVELAPTRATRLLSRMGGVMPHRAWRSDAVLRAMGPAAGRMLGVGHVALVGRVPNGQTYQVNPRLLWGVRSSRAVLHGRDLGPAGALPEQDKLGDFWLPQRGLFVIGEAFFETYDPKRHSPASPGHGPRWQEVSAS